jgi:hypothetical protein
VLVVTRRVDGARVGTRWVLGKRKKEAAALCREARTRCLGLGAFSLDGNVVNDDLSPRRRELKRREQQQR